MALYHFHVTQIKRSAGQSAIAAAAYRAGEKLHSEYYGENSDYTRKGGVLHNEILLPPNAPPEYADRETLWNSVEKTERNKKAQLAYSFDIALQNELTMEENIALARRFVQEELVSRGMICDLAVHLPDKKDGIPNPHFHVMAPMRPLNQDGTWGGKQRREYVLDENGERKRDAEGNYIFNAVHTTEWGTPETLEHWREVWCRMVNEELERKGVPERVDHRTYAAQGVEQIPTVHEGPLVQKMEQRGIRTSKGDLNRWIRSTNELIAALKEKIHSLLQWIADIREALKEQPREKYVEEYLLEYKELRNAGAYSEKAKLRNLQEFAHLRVVLKDFNILTLDDLKNSLRQWDSQCDNLLKQMKELERQQKALKDRITFGEHVIRLQPVIDEMNSQYFKRTREKYHQQHQQEIDLYYMARRHLKEKYGVSDVAGVQITDWKKELAQSVGQREQMYQDYQLLKKRIKELQHIQHCVDETVKASYRDNQPEIKKQPERPSRQDR